MVSAIELHVVSLFGHVIPIPHSPFSNLEDNGFNPVWNEGCEFEIINPDMALLRFVAQDEDVFGDPNFIGQAVFPVPSIKPGFRSVPLKNSNSEELELSCLLVFVEIKKDVDEELYASVRSVLRKLRVVATYWYGR